MILLIQKNWSKELSQTFDSDAINHKHIGTTLGSKMRMHKRLELATPRVPGFGLAASLIIQGACTSENLAYLVSNIGAEFFSVLRHQTHRISAGIL